MKWKKVLLFIPFILCFRVNVFALDLDALLTQSRVFLRDTASASSRQQFSSATLTTFINNGQKEVNARAWCVIGSSRITLVPGTTEYTLPSDFITTVRVTINNIPIEEKTFSFLDESNKAWITSSGTAKEYYLRVTSSIVTGVGQESIGLHPVSTFTGTMDIMYLQQPTNLSLGTDVPFNGSSENYRLAPFHQMLSFYAAYMGYMSMGMMQEALVYKQEYDMLFMTMNGMSRTKVQFNPNFRDGLTTNQANVKQ